MEIKLHKSRKYNFRKSIVMLTMVVSSGLMIWQIFWTQKKLECFESKWMMINEGVKKYTSGLASLHRYAGYGGFIHNFKNYVIRKEVHKKEIIENDLAEVFIALDNLDKTKAFLGDEVTSLVSRIRKTFLEYKKKSDFSFSEKGKNLSSTLLDRKVRVIDHFALDSLVKISLRMDAYINQSFVEIKEELDSLRGEIYWRFLNLLIFWIIGAVSYYLLFVEEKVIAKLREVKKRFSLITDHIDSIFWIALPNMAKFLYVSPAFERITARSARSIYSDSKSYQSLIAADDKEWVTKELEKGYEMGRWDIEYRIVREKNEVRWMRDKAFPVNRKDGKLDVIVGVASDITLRKEKEFEVDLLRKKADKANRAKSDFLSNMSHEIRTPLNVISGITEILKEDLAHNIEHKQNLEMLSSAQRALLSLVNDILDLSKIENNKIEIEKSVFNLNEVIEEVISIFAVKTKEKSIAINCKIEGDEDLFVVSDLIRLKQVIINILSNAIKFTDEGSVNIEVRTNSYLNRKGSFLFIISDSGIGMSEEGCSKIFESFSQAESGTTRKYGGSGLGLAISKRFIELLGGEIWVESAKGRGTDFYFTIASEKVSYIDLKNRSLPATATATATENKLERNLKILLVDDSSHNRAIIKAFLKKQPVEIDEADDGPVALEKLEDNRYDIVLLDIQMPTMSGYEVIEKLRIREKEKGSDPQLVVALSANVIKEDIEKSKKCGFDDYLTKPIKKDVLLRFLSKIC